jgi:hypothetical protein
MTDAFHQFAATWYCNYKQTTAVDRLSLLVAAAIVAAATTVVYRSPLLGFKNLPSGDVGTNSWSVKEGENKVKQIAAGTYTFYRDEAAQTTQPQPGTWIVGTMTTPSPAVAQSGNATEQIQAGLQECLNRCDDENECL